MLRSDVSIVCEEIGVDLDRTLKSIGSLGGGNHFIEAGLDNQNNLFVTVHSGSRNFGKCVADYHQKVAIELGEMFFRDDKDLSFLPRNFYEYGSKYLEDLWVAQNFASLNRRVIMKRIAKFLKVDSIESIESVHNFIDGDNIIRKGATPARLGEKVIIPFNMADGIAICEGKGSKKYNYSAPHGAGRILSRTQAKKTLDVSRFKEIMSDHAVYTTTANESTLDESPQAYKPKDIILKNIEETVEVVEFVKPIYNFKAS